MQDAQSATVWGIPGTVARPGLADAILPPAAIGSRIVARAIAFAATAWDVQGVAAWR